MSERISEEKRERIREAVMEGKSRLQVAKEEDVSHSSVLKYTRDLDIDGRERLSGTAQEMLKALMEDGYYDRICHTGVRSAYQTLRMKGFPVRRASVNGQTIYFLEDKKKEAFRKLVEDLDNNVLSYNELARIGTAFGMDAGPKDVLGKLAEQKASDREASGSRNTSISEYTDNSEDSLVEFCIP